MGSANAGEIIRSRCVSGCGIIVQMRKWVRNDANANERDTMHMEKEREKE